MDLQGLNLVIAGVYVLADGSKPGKLAKLQKSYLRPLI
jgi:hypothetical protein